MGRDKQEIARKLKILHHAEATGEVARTCRYFGIGRASFYRWLTAHRAGGEAALVNGRPIPKNLPNQTLPEIVEKVLHLRQTYHLGPVRIVWHLARHHESINNLTPADAYFDRAQSIIERREKIKRNTITQRRLQHLNAAA